MLKRLWTSYFLIALISFNPVVSSANQKTEFENAGLQTSELQTNELKGSELICTRYLDYSAPLKKTSSAWYSVNDNVMGGRSLGSFTVANNILNFSGSINTNGGGFASIRHEVDNNLFVGADRLRLSVRSDGREYSINLRDQSSAPARLAHRAPLGAKASDNFKTVEVLFSDLIPTFRGRVMQADAFKPNEALSLSVMLSDGVDGPFALNIQWIEICGTKQ